MRYLILSLFLLTACVSSKGVVDPELASTIPDDTELVIAVTDISSDSLFVITQRELIRKGHRIDEANEEMLTITTEGIDVGQSTLARYTLYIEGNSLYGRADWMPGMAASAMTGYALGVSFEGNWEEASWTTGRPQRAFASLVGFMDSIPNNYLKYK